MWTIASLCFLFFLGLFGESKIKELLIIWNMQSKGSTIIYVQVFGLHKALYRGGIYVYGGFC